MKGEIMFHLSDPTHGIRAIKFVHLNYGKMEVMRKGVGMKGHSMGGCNAFEV
jgi:surfactin synthase thioesterase subunit